MRLILSWVTAVLLFNAAAKGQILESKISEFSVNSEKMTQVSVKLARVSHVSICLEEAGWAIQKQGPRPVPQPRHSPITLNCKDVTLKELLTKLVELAPEYTWAFDAEEKVVNIYPKKDPPFGWLIESISFNDKPLQRILIDEDLLGLKRHGIAFAIGWGNQSWASAPVSLVGSNMIARNVFNRMCNQLPFKACWTVSAVSSWAESYDLKIHGCVLD